MMGWLGVIALDCNDWWKGLGDYLQVYNTSPALWLALCKLIITAKATFTYPSAHQRSLDLLLLLPRWPCPPLACCRYQCWGGYILWERVGQTTTLGILTIPFLLTRNVQVVLHHILALKDCEAGLVSSYLRRMPPTSNTVVYLSSSGASRVVEVAWEMW